MTTPEEIVERCFGVSAKAILRTRDRSEPLDAQIAALEKEKELLLRKLALEKEVFELRLRTTFTVPKLAALRIILKEVAAYFGVRQEVLMGRVRTEDVALARMTVFWLGRECTAATLTEIGRVMARDHGTVLHGCRAIRDRMDTDDKFAREINELKAAVMERLTT